MPYEYGSQQVDIPNPFRFEGIVYTARAAILILLGLYALLQVRTLVAVGDRPLAVVDMLGGLVLGRLRRIRGVRRPI